MLVGQFIHTIDDKGRIAIPAKFRRDLGSGAVITRGFDNCLVVYPKGEWERVAEKLGNFPVSSGKARAYARLFFGGATEAAFDSQGRVLLPEYLRTHAGLVSEAVILGVMNRLEIFSTSAFATYRKSAEKDEAAINKTLEELGF